MKKTIAAAICALLLLQAGCFGCQSPRGAPGPISPAVSPTGAVSGGAQQFQAQFLGLFDTVTTLIGYSDSQDDFTALAGRVKEKLREYNDLYDIYNTYDGINNLKTVNDNAGIAPVRVDPRIIRLLQFARAEYDRTGGRMNVALGAVTSIWLRYRTAGINDPASAQLPPMSDLQAAARHTDINDVIIDERASTVYLSDPEMSLDVGAVAKGYATEMTAQYFADQGVQSMLLSVGGNVRAIGEKTNGGGQSTPWIVGIQNPDLGSAENELLTVNVDGGSVVTSGTYERYYTVNGVRYHHIIDPSTLMPAAYFTSVTIFCQDSGLADALSTGVFNMPYEEGRALIESLGLGALWIMKDGTVRATAGVKNLVHSSNVDIEYDE